jgi:hypothetical protein
MNHLSAYVKLILGVAELVFAWSPAPALDVCASNPRLWLEPSI